MIPEGLRYIKHQEPLANQIHWLEAESTWWSPMNTKRFLWPGRNPGTGSAQHGPTGHLSLHGERKRDYRRDCDFITCLFKCEYLSYKLKCFPFLGD